MGSEVLHPNKLKYGLRTSTLVYLRQPFCNHEIRILVANNSLQFQIARICCENAVVRVLEDAFLCMSASSKYQKCYRKPFSGRLICNILRGFKQDTLNGKKNRISCQQKRTSFISKYLNLCLIRWLQVFGVLIRWGLQNAVWSSTRKSFVYPSVKWNFL